MNTAGVDERERLLVRLEACQKLHAEEQQALADLAALPLPLDSVDKQ